MKRIRFTEDLIIGILKELEADVSVADLCRKHVASDATVDKWKGRYGGMDVSEAKRLKGLEDENASLKRLLAEAPVAQPVQKGRHRTRSLANPGLELGATPELLAIPRQRPQLVNKPSVCFGVQN